ncbi:MAG: hypothetical protein QW177_09665 [Candidatus Nitrosotenuis sp.]
MFDISEDFIEENRANLGQFMPKSRRTGPYSKKDREARRNEVYRLHFEGGYSARRIAEMMKINRNTVNSDINYWYSKIVTSESIFSPKITVLQTKERLNNQRVRLYEMLNKASTIQEKLTIEKMITDIDSKLANISLRLVDAAWRVYDMGIAQLNRYLKEAGIKRHVFSLRDYIMVSETARQKIERILEEDRGSLQGNQAPPIKLRTDSNQTQVGSMGVQ